MKRNNKTDKFPSTRYKHPSRFVFLNSPSDTKVSNCRQNNFGNLVCVISFGFRSNPTKRNNFVIIPYEIEKVCLFIQATKFFYKEHEREREVNVKEGNSLPQTKRRNSTGNLNKTSYLTSLSLVHDLDSACSHRHTQRYERVLR